MMNGNRYKKPKLNKPLWIVIASLSVVMAVIAVLIAGAFWCYTIFSKDDTQLQGATISQVATVDEVVTDTQSISQPQTQPYIEEPTITPDEEQPQELTYLLSLRQVSYDELRELSCNQLVTVTATNTDAQIKLFECVDSLWVENEAYTCSGFVGQMGTVDNMSEDICGTPRGLYSIGSAFYRYNYPDTKLDVFAITDNTYWVDDPDSKYYNQRVEGTADMDWDSAEHMADYSNYNYGFVVNYNMPPVYNAGSAIFFHIGAGPTAGCIATNETMVLSYLSVLDKNLNPYILIN